MSSCYRFFSSFYVVRILMCIVVLIPALLLTDFGSFLSLIGYPCMGTLGLMIPASMCLSIDARSKRARMSVCDRALCWIYVSVGTILCIAGTIFSVAEVMRSNAEPVANKAAPQNPTEISTSSLL